MMTFQGGTFMKLKGFALLFTIAFSLVIGQSVQSEKHNIYWMKIKAEDKFARSRIVDMGINIEGISDQYVIAYGNDHDLNLIKKAGLLIASSDLDLENKFRSKDFPAEDAAYHNFSELTAVLEQISRENPDIVRLESVAKTIEGRDIWAVRLSAGSKAADEKPAVIYMGGHHAREHLSVEVPILFLKHLVKEYRSNNSRIVSLLNNRDIHIIPVVNPDGMEYDIKDGKYKMWRKNRSRNSDGTYGVDLNRNYGYQWGTGGSSSNPSSDTFKGPQAFSEIETQAIKNYVERHQNISILLSFHTYSELILYPWGHKYDGLEIVRDKQVHEAMAKKMAEWNRYTPKQSSGLYIASGDTTDWSYGVHKIISFTFELDPTNNGVGGGGFYPGAGIIQSVFEKNLEPCLYLLEYADNPYRVINVGIGPIKP